MSKFNPAGSQATAGKQLNEPISHAAAQMSQCCLNVLSGARGILTGCIIMPVALCFSFVVPMYLVMCIVYCIDSQRACCSKASCSCNSWGMWGQ